MKIKKRVWKGWAILNEDGSVVGPRWMDRDGVITETGFIEVYCVKRTTEAFRIDGVGEKIIRVEVREIRRKRI